MAAYLKDQPGLGEALKNGQSPDLAANLGRTLREEEKDFWSGDPRLKALGGTDSPAARAALIDAAGHPRSGKYAGEVLAETQAGRKQALEGFGSSQDPQQQANLAKAALHEQNLTTPAGRAAVLAGLRSEHAALRNATLGATQFRGGQWADDPKFGQEVAREGLKLLRSEDPTERSKALQLLDTTLRGTKMDPAFKSQAYGELRNLAKNAQDPTEARRLDWAADSLSTTFNHYGQKSFEDGVLSGDPARVAKSFEFVKPDAIGLLESRLGAEKPPRKLETVLGELRGKDPKQYQQVLDNLARYSSDDQHPHDSGKVLQTQLKGADAATVQEFARRNLHEPGGYQTPVRGAIDALAAADTPATLQALAGANGGRHAYQVNEGLRSVVADPQRSASSRQTAADALSRAKPDALSAEARAGLVGYAASSRDPALKARALEKVPAPPLTDARLQKVGETYSQLMAEELKKDPLSPGMSSLKQLLRARSLHEHEDYRGKVNVGAIDRDLGELAGRSPLKDELEAIRQRALKDVLGRDPGAAQRAYLAGDDIQQRLKLMSPEDAKKHVEGEMKKLAAVDPQSAKTVSEQFAKKSAEANALKLLAQADPKAVETSLAEALRVETQRDPALERDLKVDAVKLAHEGSQAHGAAQEHERKKIAKQIRDALEHVDRGADASTGASQLASILSKVQPGETPEDAALRLKALRFTEHMQKNGRIGSLFFGVGLASNLASGIEHPELLAQQTAGILNVAGDASEVAKLFNLGKVRQHGEGLKEFGKLTNMGKVVKVLEFAGPVGDAVGMGFDINSALDNFKAGDTFGASMNIAGAVGGGASVVAGICIAAGASGPAAPIVLVAGTVIGLLAWGADSLWGESEEESFLRRGVKIDGRERNYWLG